MFPKCKGNGLKNFQLFQFVFLAAIVTHIRLLFNSLLTPSGHFTNYEHAERVGIDRPVLGGGGRPLVTRALWKG